MARLLHLADLHINTTRHSPRAYQRLCRQINATARDLTVICGDVFDGLATPGDILVFTQLLTAMNTPLVVILGNHDYDMRSPTKTNTIEAVLAAYPHTVTPTGATYRLPSTSVYFATRPGEFRCGAFPARFTLAQSQSLARDGRAVSISGNNGDDTLSSGNCGDDTNRDGRAVSISGNNGDDTIANNSGNDPNISTTNDTLSTTSNCGDDNNSNCGDDPLIALVHAPTVWAATIAAHDFVLAGDIHARRFIAPTAAYCGSPLQTSIKEGSVRGGIIWDIGARRGTAVDFPSKHGYAKYVETALQPGYTRPKHVYGVRIESGDADILGKFAAMGIPAAVCQVVRPFPVVPDAEIAAAVYERQRELQEPHASGPLHIRYLAFSDIRCYGPDNHVDFDALGGLRCLVADNRHGKTSLIYALCVALYGRPPRGEVRHVLRGPSGFARCTFACGATYTVTHTYRGGRLHGYSLVRDGAAVAVTSGADLSAHICRLIGPMARLLMLVAPLNLRDDFIARPSAEQTGAIHAICGHHKYTEWIKDVRAEAAQHLAGSRASAPADVVSSAALQQCVRARQDYKRAHVGPLAANGGRTARLATLVAASTAADAAYVEFKAQHMFAPRTGDLEHNGAAELRQLAYEHIAYGQRLMQYARDKDAAAAAEITDTTKIPKIPDATKPAGPHDSMLHDVRRLRELRAERDRCRAAILALDTEISARDARATDEYARLKQRVAAERAAVAAQNEHARKTHAAAVCAAAHMHRVAAAHLEMIHVMAAAAVSAFVVAAQDIADTLLRDTGLALVIRSSGSSGSSDAPVIDLVSNGVCVSLDAASGFEYTVGALVLRAAMLRLCGGSLMIIDDATDQISATMCPVFLLLLQRMAGMLPAVLVITQVEYIQQRVATVYIARGTFSTIAVGRAISAADVPTDSRSNPVVVGAIPHYVQVAGGYLCTRCAKRTIVKNPHTRHNKMHE
jgi:predicted MPP superfamily phosphohydrolase